MQDALFIVVPKKGYEELQRHVIYKYYRSAAGLLQIAFMGNDVYAAQFVGSNEMVESQDEDNLVRDVFKKFIICGTEFQIRVWEEIMHIPAGEVKTYQQIAESLGKPQAYRAVANAVASNKIAYFIPCHRVIRQDNNLGGYKWGVERKELLLKSEGAW